MSNEKNETPATKLIEKIKLKAVESNRTFNDADPTPDVAQAPAPAPYTLHADRLVMSDQGKIALFGSKQNLMDEQQHDWYEGKDVDVLTLGPGQEWRKYMLMLATNKRLLFCNAKNLEEMLAMSIEAQKVQIKLVRTEEQHAAWVKWAAEISDIIADSRLQNNRSIAQHKSGPSL